MISKLIFCKAKNDNYKRLASYIADASHAGEKSLMVWCAGCWAGDDYDTAIQEVADTQDLNTRTIKEKTYHLVISFRPEDEAKLTPETFKEIETEFAEVLGFQEHQRHCGVHQNTANIHMHIAYNMIHPEKLIRHEPYRDFWKRDRLCRELEIKYGLTIDNGKEKQQETPALIPAAATVEAQTGQESFDGYAKRHKAEIMTSLENAASWQDVHKALTKYGMTIKPQGNGLALVSSSGKHGIKASNFDHNFSKSKLEKQFGKYQVPSEEIGAIKPEYSYEKRPLQLESDRGQLYQLYRAGFDERIRQLDLVKRAENRDKREIADKWELERSRIKKLPLPRDEKLKLTRLSRVNQKIDTLHQIAAHNKQREGIKQEYPFNSWNQFLKWQAQDLGNETALAILRSKNAVVEPEKQYQLSTKWFEKEKEIFLNEKLLKQEKNALLAIIKMKQLAEGEAVKGNPASDNIKHHIDSKGTVIFTLPNGKTVRDTGKAIHFGDDALAREVAFLLAKSKWGNKTQFKDNQIVFAPGVNLSRKQSWQERACAFNFNYSN